jgi:hypothetical protein
MVFQVFASFRKIDRKNFRVDSKCRAEIRLVSNAINPMFPNLKREDLMSNVSELRRENDFVYFSFWGASNIM